MSSEARAPLSSAKGSHNGTACDRRSRPGRYRHREPPGRQRRTGPDHQPQRRRAGDYIEANSIFSCVLAKPLRAGKRAFVPSALDVPHSWTSIADVAKTLVTVATDERALGKAWPVPTNPALTIRQLATRFTEVV